MAHGRKSGDHLGDYELIEILSEGALTRSWRARQLSVEREVILEIVKKRATANADVIPGFLADIRVKARLQHSAIGHVYEAHTKGSDCYYAREALSGKTLETWLNEGKKLTPLQVVIVLESIADSQIHCESHGFATVPWQVHHLHLSDELELKLVNLAVDGSPTKQVAEHNKQLLGEIFHDLLDTSGHPGTTRTISLLDYMSNEQVEVTMSWELIREYAQTVRQQLTSAPTTKVVEKKIITSKLPPWAWALVGGLVVIIIIIAAAAINSGSRKKITPESIVENAPETHVQIRINDKKSFALGISEVSIANYAAFLEHLDLLPEKLRKTYDHPEQPSEKTNHLPDDWAALLNAAQNQTNWNEVLVTLDCPVVGVDWWDAFAYAKWKKERLPSTREWTQAYRDNDPKAISAWGPARASLEDRTASGLIGMAGNVAEWVEDRSVNPANPLDPIKPVACGGSYLNPGKGHLTRQWLDSRDVRRPDLGFRTAKDGQ